MLGRFPLARLSFILSSALASATSAVEPISIEILHSNDTHSFAAGVNDRGNACDHDEVCCGGYARIAEAIRTAKVKNPDAIALDAGDKWQGTLFFSTGGPDLIEAYQSEIPWDAATIGNHEFDAGCERLKTFVERTPFPTLAANIVRKNDCPLSEALSPEGALKPYIIKTIHGLQGEEIKVGIFGLANNEAVEISNACPATEFLSCEEAARRAVKALEAEGIQHIIALTHEGYEEDQALARAVPQIDVIVGGHTHSLLGEGLPGSEGPYPTVVEHEDGSRTLVVQAKCSTEYLGRLCADFDDKGRVVGWRGSAERLLPDAPRSKLIEAITAEAVKAIDGFRLEKITENRNIYADGLDPCRYGECLSGMLTADAFLEFGRAYGARIAILNSGAIRSALPLGPVDRGTIREMHPFGNLLAVLDIPGAVLLAALEHGLSSETVDGPRLLQVAGMRYQVDPKAPVGRRLIKAEVKSLNGSGWDPVDPASVYRTATESYLAEGGDKFAMLSSTERIPADDASDADVLETYLAKFESVPMPETGRIIGFGPWKD